MGTPLRPPILFLLCSSFWKSSTELETPSISGDGRYVTFVSDFGLANVERVHGKYGLSGTSTPPIHNVYLYDRELGITALVSDVYPDRILGRDACCPTSSSSYAIGGCSLEKYLQGRCCDQNSCSRMNMNAEISGDGTKVVWIGDVPADDSHDLPKGDLEVFVHDIPTDTTHRITYTNDATLDGDG